MKVYERDDRVRTVYGRAMTQGETPREAADEWIFFHGDVFGSALDLEEFRDVKLRYAPEGKERRVFMYRQEMDGLPVIDSSFRVMTEGQPDSGAASVVYAAGRVAIRPQGGLPDPSVTAGQALQAAERHQVGQEMLHWAEADLVAIYDDAPAGSGVAYPAWSIEAMGETSADVYTFYIDAVTGDVARYHSNLMHANDVEGTVTGNATPVVDNDPDGKGPDPMGSVHTGCENDPDEFPLHDILVSAYLDGTQTLVDDDLTDQNGDYLLAVSSSTDVDIFAELKGEGWFVLDGSDCVNDPGSFGVPIAPLAYSGNPVTSPASGIALEFNPSPSAKWTAFVNAHKQLSRVWRWVDPPNSVPVAPVVAYACGGAQLCDAVFAKPGSHNPHLQGNLRFRQGDSSECASSAYSTYIAHEYGHFIQYHMLQLTGFGTWYEGCSDALALLHYDAEVFAQDRDGCDEHLRFPREGGGPSYPMCADSDCSLGMPTSGHCRGELLAALWLDMQDEFDLEDTRTLFLDWLMVAQIPGSVLCPDSVIRSQSADEGTVVEVLQVADDEQVDAICAIFLDRNIEHPDPTPNPCEESAGWTCYADCDGNGALDWFDFLCFQEEFAAGSLTGDCDGDNEFTLFDFLCFQNAFLAGCP